MLSYTSDIISESRRNNFGPSEIIAERERHHSGFASGIIRIGERLPPGISSRAKGILETRPIYHQSDEANAGHLFCSFLAPVLRKELDERLAAAGLDLEWADVVRDLDRVEEVTVDQDNKRFVLRTQAPGCAGAVCKALGIALPPLVQQLPAATPPPAPAAPPKLRRGRPRRGGSDPDFPKSPPQIRYLPVQGVQHKLQLILLNE